MERRTEFERFMDKVNPVADGCWLWTANKDRDGYGLFGLGGGRSKGAHRYGYEAFVGPVPEGMTLDHLCRVRLCVNPAHLEPVPHRVNILRGTSFTAVNAAKTHCNYGHPFDDENTYVSPAGARDCRICRRRRMRDRDAKRRAARDRARGLKA